MLHFAWLTSATDCDCFVIALPAFRQMVCYADNISGNDTVACI